jgi:two-component system NtrC family sensor kinase
MSIIKRIKPSFWDHYDAAAGENQIFSFRRKWKLIVLLTSIVALTPLIIMTLIDFRLTRDAIESEEYMNTSRIVSNSWRSVSYFLSQRKFALTFIAADNSYDALQHPGRLSSLLASLKTGIGGFKDIGLVDSKGNVRAYAGPDGLEGINICNDECFRHVVENRVYIRDVAAGPQPSRQLIIAVKSDLPDNNFFVLRSALDAGLLHNMLLQIEIGERDDIFLISDNGILQTPSRFHGGIYQKVSLPIPEPAPGTRTMDGANQNGEPVFIAYAHIPDTPFILMLVKPKSEIAHLWFQPRLKLIGFLILSIAGILLAILGTATYLVNRIHAADRIRVAALHQLEYSNKLASLGRLASGVAHEINNPLAIIDQKAGLIKDLFLLKEHYVPDDRLMGLIDSILSSVKRTGSVTQRLLNFARHMDTHIESINLKEMVNEILGFLTKEADYRHIETSVNISDDIVEIESARGNLQQIFLNIFNNAFAAMDDGGRLDITVAMKGKDAISITIADNGHGIPPEDLKHIFEPFFTTRSAQGGTGLGLSITYGMVQEIEGDIAVESKLGEGTRFIITLPLMIQNKKIERAHD